MSAIRRFWGRWIVLALLNALLTLVVLWYTYLGYFGDENSLFYSYVIVFLAVISLAIWAFLLAGLVGFALVVSGARKRVRARG